MHVVMLHYAYGPGFRTAEQLLERYTSVSGWAEGVAGAGAQVTVVQRFQERRTLTRGPVRYEFVPDAHSWVLGARQLPAAAHSLVRELRPDLVHVQGLMFPLQTRALRIGLPRRCAMLAQHHAEQPWHGLRGVVQRWALQALDGFMFTAHGLARRWVARGMIRPQQPVYEVPEGSMLCTSQDREAARAATGLTGEPTVLWVGRLNANKDPLTVLAAFERTLAVLPAARLYMAYSADDMLPQVQAHIAASPRLAMATTLLGHVPHEQMERLYSAADLFVLGSAYEGGGFALIEALACGISPVVSDIPSFRVLTADGRLGALWPVGDAAACAAALVRVARRPRAERSAAVRRHFEAHLSYGAIGRQAVAAYADLCARRAL